MKIEEFLDKELICDIDVNGMDSLFSIIAHIFSQKYLSIDKEKLKRLLINYKKRMREKDFIKIISFFKKI